MITSQPPHHRRRLASLAREESGIALIAALLTLFIASLMAAAAVVVATQTNGFARSDVNRKNALEAAEAGLQVALYRINMLQPSTSNCVGDTATSPGASGWCASSTYTLGNGSQYQYYTAPVSSSNTSCAGSLITSSDVNQRCITAVGTSNGVVERSQIRAAAFAAAPLFPYAGITGLNGVAMNGNVSVGGVVASNQTISINGNDIANGIVLGPAGKLSSSGNVSIGGTTRLTSPIVLDPVNPGTSNQTFQSGCPKRQTAGYPSCNDDYRISNGLASPVVSPYDQSSGHVSFTASTRTLAMSGNSSLSLGGGIYNFCNFTQSGNATINIAAGAHVEIIIDSPDDPGSGCPAGSGSFTLSGNVTWNNPNDDPTTLQIYVYGWNNGQNTVSFDGNSGLFWGVLYAPQSTVTLNGNAGLDGAIAAAVVNMNGNAFNWDSRASTLSAGTNGLYYRTAWVQCAATYSSSSPGSGCG
jgi:Tfp pilus assembly protein PilX